MEYVVLIALLIAGFAVMFLLLRRIVNRWFTSTSQLDRVEQEVEKLLVELNHATASNIDLIEARIRELKEMLAVVDKRIGLLKREEEKHEVGKKVYNKIVKTPPVPIIEQAAIPEPSVVSLRDKILNLYHSGFSSPMIASQVGKTVGEVELVISLSEKE